MPSIPSEPTKSTDQVEAGFVLVHTAAGSQDFTVGQHHFQADDVIACDAILQTAWAACVGSDVSANRAIFHARGVRWIK